MEGWHNGQTESKPNRKYAHLGSALFLLGPFYSYLASLFCLRLLFLSAQPLNWHLHPEKGSPVPCSVQSKVKKSKTDNYTTFGVATCCNTMSCIYQILLLSALCTGVYTLFILLFVNLSSTCPIPSREIVLESKIEPMGYRTKCASSFSFSPSLSTRCRRRFDLNLVSYRSPCMLFMLL